MDSLGAYVVGTGAVEIRPAEVPAFGDDDVLVKMLYCGVCGSDLHFYQYGEAELPGVLPFILGTSSPWSRLLSESAPEPRPTV